MENGRVFRFLVMFLTLVGVLWAIREIAGHRPSAPAAVQPTAVKAAYTPAADGADYSLPLVAFENSCEDGQKVDISECTGKLSRSEGRTYRLKLDQDAPVMIEVRPLDGLFDPSFALIDEYGHCLIGIDDAGEAASERGEIPKLAAGRYELIVSGYGDQCGPFQLTVREPLPLLTMAGNPQLRKGGNGASLHWETFGENDITHFKIYRLSAAGRSCVTTVRSHGSPAGTARYRWVDRKPAEIDAYELEAIAGDGRTQIVATVAS
ncbi:hypothetical protein HZB60_02150 [candidate division KSB1 bacterium]|nr:hypothetical protein [candidate division KSB1 bacterium]